MHGEFLCVSYLVDEHDRRLRLAGDLFSLLLNGNGTPNCLHIFLIVFSYSLFNLADCCSAYFKSSISSKNPCTKKQTIHVCVLQLHQFDSQTEALGKMQWIILDIICKMYMLIAAKEELSIDLACLHWIYKKVLWNCF